MNIINQSLTKEQTKFNEERITFSTKDAGTSGYTHEKKFWMQIIKLP